MPRKTNQINVALSKFRTVISVAIITVLSVVSVDAATYYVAKNGVNTNPGSKTSPLLTIGAAATKTLPGDTVRVQPGLYDERISITKGGTNGAFVNYVAEGQAICRGFDLTKVDFVRVIGFEITHVATTFVRGITLNTNCSFIEILDNNIHDVNGAAIQGKIGAVPAHITVRGNTITYAGRVPNVATNPVPAINSSYITPSNWLVEYNTIIRSGDFIDIYGTNHIVRNNYLRDFSNPLFSTTDSFHSDMFQPGSDGVVVGTRHHVYERNFCGDSIETNSHFGIWQDTVSAGDTNILIRGNVAFNFGSGGVGVIGTDHVAVYNNTFYKMQQTAPGYVLQWYKRTTMTNAADLPTHCIAFNTIIAQFGKSADAIYFQDGTDSIASNNLGFQAGSEPSYVSTGDPLFHNEANHDFHIQSGSPAIGAGTNVASVTSPAASGTTFNVSDGQLLNDGWGMVDGDTVTVGGKTTRIISITGNTVTVADPVTWTNGAPVYWGGAPSADIGALPFGSTDLTAASLVQSGDVYTVTPDGDTRGVWFYVDGIPTIWDSTPPFTATIANGIVTAKAYALYAQADPVVDARGKPNNLRAVSP